MVLTNRSLEASHLYDRFVAVLETQVAHLGGGEEAHYTFRSKYVNYYSDYIDLLIAQQNADSAFEVAERQRAQTLLQTLSSSRLRISKGIPQNLLEREQVLRDLFAAKNNNRIRLQASGRRAEELVEVNREISEIRAKWDTVEAEIREHNRNYAGLTRPRVLSIREIQREVLDADTVLLEYSLGQERSHLWIVSAGSSTVVELPPRNEIDDLSRHLYDLLTVRGRQKVDGAGATGINVAEADAEFPQVAAALSNLVLGPAAELIKRKRLLIVSDGALELIPFAALPVPFSSGEAIPMIVEHEIVNLPSVAVLAEIRRQAASRSQPARAIAVLADPVFDSSDERVSANRQRRSISKERSRTGFIANRSVSNTASSANRGQFVRLPFTRQEANAIKSASPDRENLIALDFRANRSLAISGELAKYRIVHFATHGILDSTRPELSGLVFSMVDEAGQPQNGFLGLEDIYNLNLPADLVVLSGCETGLGKEIRGEGLIGLTRGFFFAGAIRIIASSWRVDDFATAELQKRVYRHMAGNRMRPAAALRAAQIEMARTAHWKFPFYWAAFEVFGEWN